MYQSLVVLRNALAETKRVKDYIRIVNSRTPLRENNPRYYERFANNASVKASNGSECERKIGFP